MVSSRSRVIKQSSTTSPLQRLREEAEDTVGSYEHFRGETITENIEQEPVFSVIHRLRKEIILACDSVVSYEQLKSPTVNLALVRPLEQLFLRGLKTNPSILYALLVNRVQFLEEATKDLAFNGLNTTRANLCELLAIKLLPGYESAPKSLELLSVLTCVFTPTNGITRDMVETNEEYADLLQWGSDQPSNALELAVFSGAKRFVKTPIVCQIFNAIYDGTITYSPGASSNVLLNDDYMNRPIVQVYDWTRNPFLDHYRLRVPQIRTRLEFLTYFCMVFLFILTQTTHELDHINFAEGLFIAWALGFALDELAALLENGLTVYMLSVYNMLDTMFIGVFLVYLVARGRGLLENNFELSSFAFNTLAFGGILCFPRLTISLLRGNIVLLALSAMVKEFLFFMFLACLTASGFLSALAALGAKKGEWKLGNISWLLFKIWLGNSFLGFEAAQSFDPLYGPILIVLFAILSQTLLLTILISLLSNTFAAVQANAETELINQQALRTIERVKNDALTSYMPPLNIIAFVILAISKPILSSRYFHKLNVIMIKTFNIHILLVLAIRTRLANARKVQFFSPHKAFENISNRFALEGAVDGLTKLFEYSTTSEAVHVDAFDFTGSPQQQETGSRSDSLRDLKFLPKIQTRVNPGKSLKSATAKERLMTWRNSDQVLDSSIDARLASIEAALKILVGEVAKAEQSKPSATPPLTSLTGASEPNYND